MRTQAILWLTLITAAPWIPFFAWVLPATTLVSYAVLWRIVDAGRTLADGITAVRLVALVVATATAAALGGLPAWLVVALCVTVSGDLLDGWAARHFGGTPGGALLDMEADQFTTLALAELAWLYLGASPFVLALPLFRYAYVLVMSARGKPIHDPKPLDGDNRRAKTICAIVVVLQLIMLLPTASPALRTGLTTTAIALFAISYASDGKNVS